MGIENYQPAAVDTPTAQPWLKSQGSPYFLDWLGEQSISLAFTTYQTSKLFFVGRKPDSSISMFDRTFGHCMGMWTSPDAKTIWLSFRYQIWKMTQAPAQAVPHRPVEPDNPASHHRTLRHRRPARSTAANRRRLSKHRNRTFDRDRRSVIRSEA